MRAFVLAPVLVALLVLPAPVSAALPPLVTETVHFEVPAHDLIPMVAAFRASCDVVASGEPLTLRDNETVRTTIAAAPGNCSMILILFGYDVTIPTITTTPIGRSSFYIPGATTITLGMVDVSLDLQSSLSSTSRVTSAGVANVSEPDVDWGSWGATRLAVQGAHGYGSVASGSLETNFTYALRLGITIWVAGFQAYHTDVADFGAYLGDRALDTPVSVDLLPHPLTLGPAAHVTTSDAVLNWSGIVDSDVDHLEVWITDGTANVSVQVGDPHLTSIRVDLRPATTYAARIVAVDGSGQETVSASISFRTLAVPEAPPPAVPTTTESQANLIVAATFLFIALLAALVAYGFGRVRGRT